LPLSSAMAREARSSPPAISVKRVSTPLEGPDAVRRTGGERNACSSTTGYSIGGGRA
jgi:hypothetical protein